MKEKLSEVLQLQTVHSSENTPEMAKRGDLIRNLIPEELRSWPTVKAEALLPFKGRINVQGRDGTGRKTFIPWVRLHSPELSPSAQSGWYVVLLFRQDGAGVALCISHGSTRFDGSDFKPRSAEEAAELMLWGRGHIRAQANKLGFKEGVDLGSSQTLARAYEATTAYSKMYAADDLPDDEVLEADLRSALDLLGELYRAVELGRAPDTEPPELIELKQITDQIARPASPSGGSGQGFGLTGPERLLVELHAMARAQSWLEEHGYHDIKDVHLSQSCDFTARKDGNEFVVEVKGTTAGFGTVILTANEVALHRDRHPFNLLLVVSEIELLDMRSKATGGDVTALERWVIDDIDLKPLSYQCQIKKPGP